MGRDSKIKATLAAVAIACAVWLGVQTWRTDAPPTPADPSQAAADRTGAQDRSATPGQDPSASERTTIPGQPGVDAMAAAARHMLRVRITGVAAEHAEEAVVTATSASDPGDGRADARATWTCRGATSDFPLDAFLADLAAADADAPPDTFTVTVDHPLHMVAQSTMRVADGVAQDDGRILHRIDVQMVPAAILHGRLVRDFEAPATEGYVGAILLQDDFPIDAEGHAARCAADGTFEVRVPASGRYAVAAFEQDHRPTTIRVDAVLGSRTDLETVVLERGHTISGRVLRQGKPLVGTTVTATPPTWKTPAAAPDVREGMHSSVYEGRNFRGLGWSRHLLWLPRDFMSRATQPGLGSRENGRFELPAAKTATDDRGAFRFVGLGAGDYLLRLGDLATTDRTVAGYWDRNKAEGRFRIHGSRPALVVRAPAQGVAFPLRWTSLRFELSGGVPIQQQGRVFLKTPTGHRPDPTVALTKGMMQVGEYHTDSFEIPAARRSFELQVPPTQRMVGEVVYAGRTPVPFDVRMPDEGGAVVVPVVLTPAAKQATLVIAVENPPEELPDAFRVLLWRRSLKEFPPQTHPATLRDGKLQVRDVYPGTYRVEVRAGHDPYSQRMLHGTQFEAELHPGLTTEHAITMTKGASLRIAMRDEQGQFLGGQYEFFDDQGESAILNTFLRDGADISASSWKLWDRGIHESYNDLSPGRYRLVLRSRGYREERVIVDLRAGQQETVDIKMAK